MLLWKITQKAEKFTCKLSILKGNLKTCTTSDEYPLEQTFGL